MLSILIVTILISSFLSTLGVIFGHPVGKAVRSTGWFDFDSYNAIDKYCTDVTEKAKRGDCHDFFTKDAKVNNLVDILSFGERSNPCIVGSPGVGKNALVEGLAYRIENGTANKSMQGKRILKVDTNKLIVGRGYGGDSNTLVRLRAVLEKAKSDKNIILFVNDVYKLSKVDGALQLINTYLSGGDVKMIIALTDEEFSAIPKDSDLNQSCTYLFL